MGNAAASSADAPGLDKTKSFEIAYDAGQEQPDNQSKGSRKGSGKGRKGSSKSRDDAAVVSKETVKVKNWEHKAQGQVAQTNGSPPKRSSLPRQSTDPTSSKTRGREVAASPKGTPLSPLPKAMTREEYEAKKALSPTRAKAKDWRTAIPDGDGLMQELKLYQRSNEILQNQIQSAMNQNSMHDQFTRLHDDVLHARIAVKTSQEENKTLYAELRRLAEELNSGERDEYERQLSDLNRQIAAYKERLASYTDSRNGRLYLGIEEHEKMANLENKVRALNKELIALQQQAGGFSHAPPLPVLKKHEPRKVEDSSKDTPSKASSEDVISRLEKQIAALNEESLSATETANVAKKQLSRLAGELDQLKSSLAEKDAELRTSKDLLKKLVGRR